MADPIDTGKKTVTGRTIWRDPETGKDYSERSTTFKIDNKYYTMPTVAEDGSQYTEDQIKDYVKEHGPFDYLTGEELPEFRYREDALQYAVSRSNTRKQKEEPMLQEQMELFNEGGLKDEGGMIDEESGNEVPVGGTRKGVRDDIPANVSEGEFIFPEDVTRYIGLDKLMQLRQEAKMGLKRMEAMGQMGNSDEATMEDDLPFGMADLIIVGGMPEGEEELDMAEGGLTTTSTGSRRTVAQPTVQEPTTPVTTQPTVTRRLTPEPVATSSIPIDFKQLMGDAAIEYKEYRNAAGESVMIPFVGGVAQFPVPDGYTLYSGTDAVANTNTTAGAIVRAANTATAEVRAASMGGDNDTPPPMPTAEAINWSGLSTKELIERSAELTGTGSTIAKGAMAFLGPFGAIGYAMMRHQEKKVAAEIATRLAKGGLTAAQRKSLTETQEKLAPAKVTTLFGKVIEFIGGALGLTGDDVEAAKKNTANVEAAVAKSIRPVSRPVDSSQTAQAFTGSTYDEIPFKSDAEVIADATAVLPELGEIGPIQSVSTANMASDLAEEGRAYDQSIEAATSQYRNMLLGKPLPSGQTEERLTNNIIERLGVDALREIQSSIRPDMVSPYGPVPNAALQNVDRELYRMPESDRERLKSLKLSEPGSQMTTEQQIEERKRLASTYQQPQVLADPRTTPTTTAASGFAGDQPPIAPISAAPTMSSTPSYDMFGNPQITPEVRDAVDNSFNDRSKAANLFTEVDRLLGEGSFGPQREPLSDIDPNTQLESVTPFAPTLSAVPQSKPQLSGPFVNVPRNLGKGTTLEEAQSQAIERGYVPAVPKTSNIDVVPPSPVTNLDLRPASVDTQTQQAFDFNKEDTAMSMPVTPTFNLGSVEGQFSTSPVLNAPSGLGSTYDEVPTMPVRKNYTSRLDTKGLTPTPTPTPTQPVVDTAMDAREQYLGKPRQDSFKDAFNRNRLAGKETFTFRGKEYTTQTAEEAAPAGTNTFIQSAKNILTPFDNKEYVGGKLVTTKKDKGTSKSTSKAKAPSAKVKDQVATSSGKKVTVVTKPSSKKTEGAVSAGGQYAGDGFEWVAKKNADGTPALNQNGGKQLTRTYTGVNKNATGSNDTSSASSSSDKSIVCTEMYRQTQLADWQQAMKIWHVYQEKHLTMYHQIGYHWLFQPYVKGMKNSSILTNLGSKLAKHRTQHLRHVLTKGKAKDDLLGNVWCKFIHPLVYVAGVIKEKVDK